MLGMGAWFRCALPGPTLGRAVVAAREQFLSFRKTAQIFQGCDGVLRDFRRTSARSGSTLPNQTA
jgi:hypothetical protein